MRDRLLLAALVCSLPLAVAWLLIRTVQWERRRPPIEPLDLSVWGVGSDRHPSTFTVH